MSGEESTLRRDRGTGRVYPTKDTEGRGNYLGLCQKFTVRTSQSQMNGEIKECHCAVCTGPRSSDRTGEGDTIRQRNKTRN